MKNILISHMDNFKLSHKFTFWLQEIGTVQYEQYSQSLKPVSTFSEIQQFWEIFQFLKKTSELNRIEKYILDCDMYLFKDGIKPEWEDTNNVGGGCFKIKIDKKKSNKLWEASVFAVISPKNRCIDVLNGVRIKIR